MIFISLIVLAMIMGVFHGLNTLHSSKIRIPHKSLYDYILDK